MPFDVARTQRAAKNTMENVRDGFTSTITQVHKNWSLVFRTFFEGCTIPPPLPNRFELLEIARTAAEAKMNGLTFANAHLVMSDVANLFALAIVASSVTPPGIAIPPPEVLPFVPIGVPGNIDAAAAAFVQSLLAWTVQGTYTVPGAAPVPWA